MAILSKGDKAKERVRWKIESQKREEARKKRGIHKIPSNEIENFNKILDAAKRKYSLPAAPAMPTRPAYMMAMRSDPDGEMKEPRRRRGRKPLKSKNGKWRATRPHQAHFTEAGGQSEAFLAMVHKPIPITQALKIPEAKAALEKEWKKLEGINSWDVKGVQPRQKVIDRARKSGITIHFGNIMPLCHQKNAEQGIEFRSYKGRIVFRGDAVKDESGFYAVFSEQGSSASHMAATKFIDAIARLGLAYLNAEDWSKDLAAAAGNVSNTMVALGLAK